MLLWPFSALLLAPSWRQCDRQLSCSSHSTSFKRGTCCAQIKCSVSSREPGACMLNQKREARKQQHQTWVMKAGPAGATSRNSDADLLVVFFPSGPVNMATLSCVHLVTSVRQTSCQFLNDSDKHLHHAVDLQTMDFWHFVQNLCPPHKPHGEEVQPQNAFRTGGLSGHQATTTDDANKKRPDLHVTARACQRPKATRQRKSSSEAMGKVASQHFLVFGMANACCGWFGSLAVP